MFTDVIPKLVSNASLTRKPIEAELLNALREFNAGLPESPRRQEQLNVLENPASVVIATGQQVGLFSGPLFTLYKIVSACKIASGLREEHNIPAVPLFWVQSEDHDYEEIRSTRFLSREGDLQTISLPELNASRRSVAHLTLGHEIEPLIQILEQELGMFPAAPSVLEKLKAAYKPGISLNQAFTHFLADIFSPLGLVFLDPQHPAIHKSFAPLFKKSLEDFELVGTLLATRAQELSESGAQTPVHIRKNSPLIFIHPQGADADRYRIERVENRWNCIQGTQALDDKELSSLLDEPGVPAVSSSALLRPLIQDSILPTLAYVGGSVELAYFEQIGPLYSLWGITPSYAVEREHVLLVDAKLQRWMEDLKISLSEALLPEESLKREVLKRSGELGDSAESLRQTVQLQFNQLEELLRSAFVATDKTLASPLSKTMEKMHNSLQGLLAKYEKAQGEKNTIENERIMKLQRSLLPEGAPQERGIGAISFLMRYGTNLIDLLSQPATETEAGFRVIRL